MKQSIPKTIDDYIAASDPAVRGILRKVRATIAKAAPGAEEVISYRMPAFKQHGVLAYFAAFKAHIGFYPPVPGDAALEKAAARFAGEKGNLRFPLDEPIPYGLIARIVRHRVRLNAKKAGTRAVALALFVVLAGGSVRTAQQPAPVDTLGAGPWDLGVGRGRVHVEVVTRGLDHPWGIAFVPGGDMLVTERPGRLRVIRRGTLDPTPIGPLPAMLATGLGGLLDVALHPQFATNRLIYLTYSKPGEGEGNATTAVLRARWDGGSALTGVQDILVADAYHGGPGSPRGIGPASGSYGSRLAFDRNGLLYVSLGDRNHPPKAQDPSSHIGKILRVRDDGTVPPDNPFVGRAGYKPEIYTLGHRNPLGLAFHPVTNDLWSTEEGPQGGDELNLIQAGKNYGWPRVSLGRNYDGTRVGEGFTAPGLEEPVVYWVPAIAISGLSFYDGDKFPQWKGNALVGGMRANTGRHIQRVQFNAQGLPTNRELLLGELNQRIREVKPGPDGFVYAITDETFGAVLRIEPPR